MLFLTHTDSIFYLIFMLIRAHTILSALENAFSAHSLGSSVFILVLFYGRVEVYLK